jgi:hypothetical protein
LDTQLAMEKLDVVLLALDESIDHGVILETDPQLLYKRIGNHDEKDVPLADQTITQALGVLKNTLAKYT